MGFEMIPDLCVGDVAEMLGVHEMTVYRWCQKKTLPHYKIGGSLRFKREDIEAWVGKRKVTTIRRFA